MSIAPEGSDNSSAPASRGGGDTFALRSSENLFQSAGGSSYLSDSALKPSPGFGQNETDPQKSLDTGLAANPYSTVFASPSDAPAATPATVTDGGTTGDNTIARTTGERSTETEPTDAQPRSDRAPTGRHERHSTSPSEPADMRLARSARGDGSPGGGGG